MQEKKMRFSDFHTHNEENFCCQKKIPFHKSLESFLQFFNSKSFLFDVASALSIRNNCVCYRIGLINNGFFGFIYWLEYFMSFMKKGSKKKLSNALEISERNIFRFFSFLLDLIV